MVHAYGGYMTNLALEDLATEQVILARRHNGRELTLERGWPLRLIVPQRYAWKSPKWVSGFEFMVEDKPGIYEQRGYHVRGDPWKEERFWPQLPMDLALTVAICGTSEKYKPIDR